jgi:hypothetical protein
VEVSGGESLDDQAGDIARAVFDFMEEIRPKAGVFGRPSVAWEIQYMTGGRGRSPEKWLPERRFHQDISWGHVDRTWDSLVSLCAGRSWRLVQVSDAGTVVERGPTEVVPGEPWGPAPGSASLVPPLRFEQFTVKAEPQEIPEAFRRRDLTGDQDELPVAGRLDRSRGGRRGRQVPVREVDVQVLRERGQDLGEFADGHGTAPLSTQAAKAPNPHVQAEMLPRVSPLAANAPMTNRTKATTRRMRCRGQEPAV